MVLLSGYDWEFPSSLWIFPWVVLWSDNSSLLKFYGGMILGTNKKSPLGPYFFLFSNFVNM